MKQLSEFIDAEVVDANGDPVGAIDELVLDCRSGKIDRVIVKTADQTRFCLNWTDLFVRGHQIHHEKKGYIVSMGGSQSDLIKAPLEKFADRLAIPFRDFFRAQSASGRVLISATFLAMVVANSFAGAGYFEILHLEFGLVLGEFSLSMSLQHWVNDGLMALFFFLLGLELKREFLVGKLRGVKRASALLFAAAGGMLLPAVLFLLIADQEFIRNGWAIPVATDTAFAITLLSLLGKQIPASARAFLVGLAIIDDLGAIMVIAIAYTSDFNTAYLLPVGLTLTALITLNLAGIQRGLPYLLVGAVLWLLFLKMGLHGTLTGVVVALAAPVRPQIARKTFLTALREKLWHFEDTHDAETDNVFEQPEQQQIAHDIARVAEKATVPLRRWETRLEKPISFIVVPLFALMNAGLVISAESLKTAWSSDLGLAIALGLLIGKPAGILGGMWLGRRLGWADLPGGLLWRHILGLGLLGSIGFTMSLFITNLSFGGKSDLLEIAKLSVIATSLLGGLLGYSWLRWACPAKA